MSGTTETSRAVKLVTSISLTPRPLHIYEQTEYLSQFTRAPLNIEDQFYLLNVNKVKGTK